jgi:tRNA G18 (ribose-2'-O)-methylase SpoU
LIQTIDRTDDPRLASYARVGDPAWLREHGLFVAEGRLVVRRLFELRRFEVESVLVTPAALAALQDVLPGDVPAYVADQAILNAVTGFNFHRGCLALARRAPPSPPALVVSPFRLRQGSGGLAVASAEAVRGDLRALLALEGIGNPDNVGGLFRVAAAFGVDGVLLDPTSGDPLYRKAIRTSMGAVLSVPFVRLQCWPAELDTLKRDGFRALALTPRADAQPLDDVLRDVPSRWILLAGAEGPGLSDAALDLADVRVRVPTSSAVDSLNVAVAAGIVLSRLYVSGV